MSTKYPGGFITKSPVAPTSTAASGIWTLDQQEQAQQAGTWPSPPIFIEDMFSAYTYTGTGQQQTIPNGINMAAKGGLIWTKSRSNSLSHILFDTVQGWYNGGGSHLYSNYMSSNSSNAQAFLGYGIGSPMLSNGYTIGFNDGAGTNACDTNIGFNGYTYVSWTFAIQPKFFDIVSYTGTGSARTVAHNLGATPGCIIVKRTDSAGFDWAVYHTSTGNTQRLLLNTTDPAGTASTFWNNTTPTSTVFTVGSNSNVNASGGTYIAYLFANNAGGFPASGAGSTNGITCGSVTIDGGGQATVNLGYEPQWILYKSSSDVQNWYIYDTMRGMPVGTSSGPYSNALSPNATTAEFLGAAFAITPTGFNIQTSIAGATYIYVAIRKGPMKTPTTGTSVYNAIVRNGTNAVANVTGVGFPPDLITVKNRNAGYDNNWVDKLRGALPILAASNTAAEVTDTTTAVTAFGQDGVTLGDNNIGTYGGAVNFSTVQSYVNWFFRRAPSFFDEVCYTGDSSTPRTITHNLTVVPELMFVKSRSNARGWAVYASGIGANKYLILNGTNAALTDTTIWANTAPTSSVFTVGTPFDVNNSGYTYVAYLFATCPGVSKVGSYSGTGTTLQVDCGFTGGARFVMIKRTDSTGDWYVWDSARGIVAGNDPYLLLNSTATEVTGTDYVDTYSAGFEISSTAPSAINANGGTYIFLAIA